MSTHETVADIIGIMRDFASRHWMHDEGQNVRMFADRLEAVWKREKATIEADALAVGGLLRPKGSAPAAPSAGNAQKMREAVVYISKYADCVAMRQHDTHTQFYIKQIRKWADAALAEPPRNCDVGTAEEQDERFSGYCAKFIGGTCTGCPLRKFQECGIGWAQMPYEEGGAE